MGVCAVVEQLSTAVRERFPQRTSEQEKVLDLLVAMPVWFERNEASEWEGAVSNLLHECDDKSPVGTLINEIFYFAIFDFYAAFDEAGRRQCYARLVQSLAVYDILGPESPDVSRF